MTSRVLFPLSWGGDKRAGVEFQHDFASRLAPRLRSGILIQRRTHPFFQSDADKTAHGAGASGALAAAVSRRPCRGRRHRCWVATIGRAPPAPTSCWTRGSTLLAQQCDLRVTR